MNTLRAEDVPHTNQRLLVEELQRRGVEIYGVDSSIELIRAVFKGRQEYILDRFGPGTSHAIVEITADKYLAKKIMKNNGISVTKGEIFSCRMLDEAVRYITQELTFPIIIKPNWGSHGDEVVMNIRTIPDFIKAARSFSKRFGKETSFLVEEQFDGKEHRIFIGKNGDYAVMHRDPAFVIGDGIKCIYELAKIENEKRKASYDQKKLCPIEIDPNVVPNVLLVPDAGEKYYVRSNSNLAKGGYPVDMTDSIHPSVIEIANNTLASFPSMPFAGIDMLTIDPTIEQTNETYRILEVNSNPGLSMHMYPGIGEPRNVAKIVADILFPETAEI